MLVELDVGMHRVGVPDTEQAVSLARDAIDAPGLEYRGVMFYPGHIRDRVDQQGEKMKQLALDLERHLDALGRAGLANPRS